MTVDLQELMDLINARYVFNDANYPALEKASVMEKMIFSIDHSVKHMNKAIGAICAETESYDHGGAFSTESIKTATVKMLINTLKLAEELGMTAKYLAEEVPKIMKSK